MVMAISIADIMEAAHATAVKKGWYNMALKPLGESTHLQFALDRNVGEVVALVHSELSEALEEWRSGRPLTDIYYGEGGKPEGFGVELADVIIRICDTAQQLGIPLETCIVEKLAYNETRPARHGGKIA